MDQLSYQSLKSRRVYPVPRKGVSVLVEYYFTLISV